MREVEVEVRCLGLRATGRREVALPADPRALVADLAEAHNSGGSTGNWEVDREVAHTGLPHPVAVSYPTRTVAAQGAGRTLVVAPS